MTEKKTAVEVSKKPGVYALLTFACNGVKKNEGDVISKEEIQKMSKDKTSIKHLLLEVK